MCDEKRTDEERTDEDIQKGIDSVYEHVSFESKYDSCEYYDDLFGTDLKRKIIHLSVIVLMDVIALIITFVTMADYERYKELSDMIIFLDAFFLISFAIIPEIISPYCLLRLETKLKLSYDAFDNKRPSEFADFYHYFLVILTPAFMIVPFLISIVTVVLS